MLFNLGFPYQVFRNIMEMWIGLGMRESFAEWKTWTKKRIKQRRRDARTVKLVLAITKQNGVDLIIDSLVCYMIDWQ